MYVAMLGVSMKRVALYRVNPGVAEVSSCAAAAPSVDALATCKQVRRSAMKHLTKRCIRERFLSIRRGHLFALPAVPYSEGAKRQ